MTDPTPTNDLDTLRQWVGRSEESVDIASAARCNKMAATLDIEPALCDGDPLPPLWHFIMHSPFVPSAGLGDDGHPLRGGFLPPVALPRRMWAGGRFTFSGDIRIGDEVTKTSTIESVDLKHGRTGLLCFVQVRHEFTVDGELRITEDQDIVYRDDPERGTATPDPKSTPTDANFSRVITPSEVMLFRYSALTFNSHRIHYDREYARNVEGYEGLIFHGPLTATFLADLATKETGQGLASFSFRGLAPLLDTEPFTISGKRAGNVVDLWATTPTGGLAMQGQAKLSEG